VTGKKWIGYARLLAEVPCEVFKFPKRTGHPWVPWSQVIGPQVHCLYVPQGGHYVISRQLICIILVDSFFCWESSGFEVTVQCLYDDNVGAGSESDM